MFNATRRARPLVLNSRRMLLTKFPSVSLNAIKTVNIGYLAAGNRLQLQSTNLRMFSSKNDKPEKEKEEAEDAKEAGEQDAVDTTPSNKGMWFNTKQRLASKLLKPSATEIEEATLEKAEQEADAIEEPEMHEGMPVHKLYTIKFNSPILPYSKFPLTQNKYIQQFFKKYSRDKDAVDKLIGVHFLNNKNSSAEGAIGIEIELDRSSSNMNVVESKSFKRFKVIGFNETTNFSKCIEFEDRTYKVRNEEGEKVDMKLPDILASEECPDKGHFEDLINSEITDLKNTWFQFNKRMNSSLMVLPSEMLNTYDMVVKTLPVPNFEMYRYRNEVSLYELFNQITCKMAHYYFSMFQALFSKDQKDMKHQMKNFLECDDPLMRSKKVIYLFDEFTHLLDQKCYYIQKTAEDFKERSKQAMLESAFQRILENNKTSDKENFQVQLDAIQNMPDRIRKLVQEEINGMESKGSDMDSARKVTYLQHVFRLPWDKKVDAFWDVEHAKNVLEDTHFGMVDTKERILEFVAKNKRINTNKGMVLLLTGPPGVGKTTIANSIGDCLKRPTAIVSMAGQNDPSHIKGTKRTYVDSQPGIFIKELQRLDVRNPIIIIDEIDKIGFNSLRGDPSSTLLELLNPEQANTFSDNYLDFEFDFSECIFICTSNSIQNMLQPLIDRIEVIEVPPYLPTEKLSIAKKYLIPKFRDEYGFDKSKEDITFTNAAIAKIIRNYCGYEAGVRNLRKCIDRVFRKVVTKIDARDTQAERVRKLLEDSQPPKEESATEEIEEGSEVEVEGEAADIDPNVVLEGNEVDRYQINSYNLERFLDVPNTDDYYYNKINETLPVGCANGLAYIDSGYGAVLKIQFVKKVNPKDKEELIISQTGRLGEVMKESLDVVQVATFNYLGEETKTKGSYHLHVPHGAVPKDGPSAGVALFCSLISIIQNKPLNPDLAMTGEITTLGEVVSIGGVREKLTACKNHNITHVILPYSNKKDFEKLPKDFKEGFEIYFIKNIDEAYRVAFGGDRAGIECKTYDKDEEVEQIFTEEIILDDNQLDSMV
jgi:endopeptidase La